MKTRLTLFIIFAVTLFSLGLLLTVLFNSSPSNRQSLSLFYSSFLLATTGVIFYVQYLTSLIAGRLLESNWQTVVRQLRIAGLFAATVTLLALLAASRLLNWATFIVLVVVALLSELMFRRRTVKL